MCGRYAMTSGATDLGALFEADDETGAQLAPDYNIAPTDPAPIVRRHAKSGARALSMARWGLLPGWAKDGAARRINARAETVASSSAYAPSFAHRRCLVPADGWYEWACRDGRRKQAYYMTLREPGVLAFAGVWSPSGHGPRRGLTFSIVTMAAAGELARVHDRMPLALPGERWAEWLDDPDVATRLLTVTSMELISRLEIRPVGPGVGDVRNDGPELISRVPPPVPTQDVLEAVDVTRFSWDMP